MAQLNKSSVRGPIQRVGSTVQEKDEQLALKIIGFMLLHVVLAFLMRGNSLFATIHAFATLGLGLYFLTDDEPYRLIYLMGYIIGSELLWRGTGANVFWEIGKYSTIFFMTVSLFKHRRSSKINILPLFYFLFLVPSVVQATGRFRQPVDVGRLSIIDLPFYYLRLDRQDIAFNLSGPFLLAVATIYFSTVQFSRDQLRNLLVAVIGPVTGLFALAFYGVVTLSPEVLSTLNASSELTSAEIGPNQVSSMLGLAMLASLLLIFLMRDDYKGLKVFLALVIVIFGIQTMLTFSRGGFWTALIAILVAAFYFARDRQSRGLVISGGAIMFVVLNFLILPQLNDLTGGGLEERFEDTDLNRRDEIILDELIIFSENPLFGVGPGQARYVGEQQKPAHTEYTRILAEHGIFGIGSLLILFSIAGKRVLETQSTLSKAFTVSLTAWALLFFFHAATRLAAPVFVFGLAAASIYFTTFNANAEHRSETPVSQLGRS